MRRSFRGIKNPPKALTADETQYYLKKAREGDAAAIDELIKGHIRLVAAIAARLSVFHPFKAEDLFAQGLLHLIICTRKVANNEVMTLHNNFSAYIHKSIWGYLQTYIKKDHVVAPPINSAWLIIKLKEYDLNDLFQEFEHIENLTPRNEADSEKMGYHPGYIGKRDDAFPMLYQEVLNSDLFTETEKRIILQRVEGYTDEEIGRQLGVTKVTVNNKRKRMRHRINYLLGENNDPK